jgi:hypothetical protein
MMNDNSYQQNIKHMNRQENTASARLTPEEEAVLQQSMNQDEQRAVQEGTPDVTREVQHGMKPRYPSWPTSKPGPYVTPPPPGMKPITAVRAEQVVEVGYNQVTGVPSTQDPRRYNPDETKVGKDTGYDQLETAQDVSRKGKDRL